MSRARDLADSADKDIAGTLTLDGLSVSGDVAVNTDTLFVDASADSISIGTTTTNSKLNVASSQDSLKYNEGITVFRSVGSNKMFLNCVGGGANIVGSNSPVTFQYHDQTSNAVTERMRIDTSGNLLVGKTSSSFATIGVEATSTGKIRATMSSDNPISLNRTTTDGDIAVFAKDNTTVGSIGTWDGDFAIGQVNVAFKFDDGSNQILPWSVNSNLNRDNAVDLGDSTSRWKDLYLSGGVYLGGTGSANHLDDYEEGTWTPTFSGGTLSGATTQGSYVKIGQLVYIVYYTGTVTISGASGAARIGGLPFSAIYGGSSGFSIINYIHGDAVDGGSRGGYAYGNQMLFIDEGAQSAASWINGSKTCMISGVYRTNS
jgi:hypothetical protein